MLLFPRRTRGGKRSNLFVWITLSVILIAFLLVAETNRRLGEAMRRIDILSRQYHDASLRIPKEKKKNCNESSVVVDDCREVVSWEDVKKCRNGWTRRNVDLTNRSAIVIRLVGERNTGTKFCMRTLQKCFQKTHLGINTQRDFTRSKHWFQIHPKLVRPNDRGKFQPKPNEKTLLVTTHREPVDWILAMMAKPYHMLGHIAGFDNETGDVLPLESWQTFVERPWTYPRSQKDFELMNNNTIAGTVCSYDLMFSQVTPCITTDLVGFPKKADYHAHNPVYELKHDGSMEHYRDILQLRADKTRHYVHEIYGWTEGYYAVRFEDLLQHGTSFMVTDIAAMLGLNEEETQHILQRCRPQGPKPRHPKRKEPRGLRKWVDQHMDYNMEHLLGYR